MGTRLSVTCLLVIGTVHAQGSAALTLEQAVAQALKNYPSIRVSQEQVTTAGAGIQLARTAYLPRVDTVAQVNRATRNNVFGLLFPQGVVPSISGPVIGTNNFGSVWGSAAGVLVSWEPFDFGFRGATVKAANAATAHAEATAKRTQFDVAVAAADAFLTLAATRETVRAAEAAVQRADTVTKTTGAQVNAELRPGADQSRAESEAAAARTQLAQAQQAVGLATADLGRYLGQEPAALEIAPGALLHAPPAEATVKPLDPSQNPTVAEQNTAIAEELARLRILERSYFPKFNLQGSAYARGSGAEIDGRRLGGWNGLAPNTQNYAVGMTVTFPLMDLAAIRAKKAGQSAAVRTEQARSEQLAADLRAQWNRAIATLNGARRIAAEYAGTVGSGASHGAAGNGAI